jgi:hypothetical protein
VDVGWKHITGTYPAGLDNVGLATSSHRSVALDGVLLADSNIYSSLAGFFFALSISPEACLMGR